MCKDTGTGQGGEKGRDQFEGQFLCTCYTDQIVYMIDGWLFCFIGGRLFFLAQTNLELNMYLNLGVAGDDLGL